MIKKIICFQQFLLNLSRWEFPKRKDRDFSLFGASANLFRAKHRNRKPSRAFQREWLICFSALILGVTAATNAYAIADGFYLGLMMGPASNNAPSLPAQFNPNQAQPAGVPVPLCTPANEPCTVLANPRSTQFAARIYMGNKFNRFAAIESGLTFISSIRYNTRDVITYGGTNQRVRTFDLVGKGIFPFPICSVGIDIYGKAGIALAYLTKGGALNPTYFPAQNPPVLSGSNTYKNKFAPTFSVGASYDINQSWVTDVSYNVLSVGDTIGTLNYWAIALSYHFTDKYCGQFLCDD